MPNPVADSFADIARRLSEIEREQRPCARCDGTGEVQTIVGPMPCPACGDVEG